jgi:hypothetical protein
MNRRDVIAGIWLIGLGLLFLFDFFWPGILILAGLSMIITALMPPVRRDMPPTAPPEATVIDVQPRPEPQSAPAMEEPLPAALAEQADLVYRQSLLPETCPACGGPVKQNAGRIVWHDADTAACPFCAQKIKINRPPAG